MLVALGDLKEGSSFSFDDGGGLRLIFPDRSVILDGRNSVRVCSPKAPTKASEALGWLKSHCPGS